MGNRNSDDNDMTQRTIPSANKLVGIIWKSERKKNSSEPWFSHFCFWINWDGMIGKKNIDHWAIWAKIVNQGLSGINPIIGSLKPRVLPGVLSIWPECKPCNGAHPLQWNLRGLSLQGGPCTTAVLLHFLAAGCGCCFQSWRFNMSFQFFWKPLLQQTTLHKVGSAQKIRF